MASLLGVLLPLGQPGVAVALLPAVLRLVSRRCGDGVLLLFIAALAVVLPRGRRPARHCFGQLAQAVVKPRL